MPKGVYGSAFNSHTRRSRVASRRAIIGLKRGLLHADSYMRGLETSKAWNKAHPKRLAAASKRYRQRMIKALGSSGRFAQEQFRALNTEKRLKLRKELIRELNAK
jgi:hypothetical protein